MINVKNASRVLIPSRVVSSTRIKPDEIKIAWVTDAHVSTLRQDRGTAESYAKFVDWVNTQLYITAVIDTGDAIHDYVTDPDAFTAWKTEFDRINGRSDWDTKNTVKLFAPGNHDLSPTVEGITVGYQLLIEALGYNSREVLGGSKFNYSVGIGEGDAKARIITIDSYTQTNGTHDVDNIYFPDATLNWIESELLNCEEEVIILAIHYAPHQLDSPTFFPETEANKLKQVVDTAVTSRPNLKVCTIGGHVHNATDGLVTYNNLGDNLVGYRIPTYWANEKFTVIKIDKDKNITFTMIDVSN